MNETKNVIALKKFNDANRFYLTNTICHFKAKVTIITIQNEITIPECRVAFQFNDDKTSASLIILEKNINTRLYPTVFDTRQQQFDFFANRYELVVLIQKQYLKITGCDEKNYLIDNFVILILP